MPDNQNREQQTQKEFVHPKSFCSLCIIHFFTDDKRRWKSKYLYKIPTDLILMSKAIEGTTHFGMDFTVMPVDCSFQLKIHQNTVWQNSLSSVKQSRNLTVGNKLKN